MKNIDLIYKDEFGNVVDGYRIVYFYDDGHYYVGEFCKTIEGFMMGFAKTDPIEDESDIPEFISNEDLLKRHLNDLNDVKEVAIYKTDGELIESLSRDNLTK